MNNLFALLVIVAAVGSVLAAMAFVADWLAYRAWRKSIEEALHRPMSFAHQVKHLERRYSGETK